MSETPRGSARGSGELPPLQEWIEREYTTLKKEFHGIREQIKQKEPERYRVNVKTLAYIN